MRRSRFLPIFFTFLSIAFVIALYFRLRTDMSQPAKTTIAAPVKTASPTPMQTPGGETMTLVPATTSGRPNGQPADARYLGPAPNATAPPRTMVLAPHPQPRPSPTSRVFATCVPPSAC